MTQPETVIVNEQTGGRKGRKPEAYSHIPVAALAELARVCGFGAEKYEAYNFRKGYDWSLSYDAAQRHMNSFWSGETCDPESGLNHMAHAAWHCLTLAIFSVEHPELDDRYKGPFSGLALEDLDDGPTGVFWEDHAVRLIETRVHDGDMYCRIAVDNWEMTVPYSEVSFA